jgi:hypothetical protein
MSLRRRLAIILPAMIMLAMFGLTAPAQAEAGSGYTRDIYFSAGYERQVDGRTCTAASVAMMMNFIARRDLNLSQLTILRYEQPRDALRDSTQRGSDPLGWSRAATYYSGYTGRPTNYVYAAYSTEYIAIKRAAKLIAFYGKPVGLLVRHGTHAVVMTGFKSTRNPNHGDFTLTHIYYSDPLGSHHALVTAANSPVDSYLELDASPYYDNAWYGNYLIIAPTN